MVASAINFRATTLRNANEQRVSRLLFEAFPRIDPSGQVQLLLALHMESRGDLVTELYNAIGAVHDGPVLDAEATESAPTAEAFADASTQLVKQFPREQVWLCYCVLPAIWPDSWGDTAIAAAEAIALGEAAHAPTSPGETDTAELESDVEGTPTSPEFSTLDKVLIRTVISSLNDVTGHLDFDLLDDLVQEVVELNDSRAQSHFHRGFVDVLIGRSVSDRGPADNQERRAWYLVGYIIGRVRQEQPSDVISLIAQLEPRDRAALLETTFGAGAMIAPELMPQLLEDEMLEEAEGWIRAHGLRSVRSIARAVFVWSDAVLLRRGATEGVRSVLQSLIDALRPGPHDDGLIEGILRDLERRLAIALRCDGRFAEAQAVIDRLVESSTEPAERARLLVQRALTGAGVRWLESFALPDDPAERDAFLKSIAHEQETFAVAVAEGEEASPIALFAVALPVVADPGATETARSEAAYRISLAINLMSVATSPVWEQSGLLDRARAYLALLDLRSDEAGVAESGAERLRQVLQVGVQIPGDLLLDAVTDAILRDAPGSSEAARLALEQLGHRALPSLDLLHLCQASSAFRGALVAALEDPESGLSETECWLAWRAVLVGASRVQPRDVDLAGRALDALENLGNEHGHAEKFLEILDQQELWDPAWTRSERYEARYQVLIRMNRIAEARAVLGELAHHVITAGGLEEASEYLEIARDLGASEDELSGLNHRLRGSHQRAAAEFSAKPRRSGPVSIIFIGGNETQAAYRDHLIAEIRNKEPEAIIDFEFPGWSSNWVRLIEHLDRRIERADAVVVMRFVRTNLGRWVRRIASKHDRPWIACPGHGRASLERAILRAIGVARDLRYGDRGGSSG